MKLLQTHEKSVNSGLPLIASIGDGFWIYVPVPLTFRPRNTYIYVFGGAPGKIAISEDARGFTARD